MTAPVWQPLDLKTVTPAFLGRFPHDVKREQTTIPFPVPSLRGVLAYWLRAVAGPYIGDDIPELLRLESDVFGRPADAGPARPSRILLRGNRIPVGPPPDDPKSRLRYLMGPGLTDDGQPPPRMLRPGRLTIDVRNTGTPEHADLFLSALWALRTFGGIGARSRRGFGTLALEGGRPLSIGQRNFDPGMLIRDRIEDLDDVLACVEATLRDLGYRQGGFGAEEPRYPCFAPDRFRLDERPIKGRGINEVFGRVGDTLRTFRHPQRAANQSSGGSKELPRTEGYLKIAQPYADTGAPKPWPFTDGALGLPIVYTVKGHAESVTVEPLSGGDPTRRASPLWLRVTTGRNGWHLRSLAFHAEWLPGQDALQVKSGKRGPAPVQKPSPAQIRARINEWFSRLPEEI